MTAPQIMHDDAGYYVLEVLAPSRQVGGVEWRRAELSEVVGVRRWQDRMDRLRETKLGSLYDNLAFRCPNVAVEAWHDLSAVRQDFPIRLVRVQETVTRLVMFEQEP